LKIFSFALVLGLLGLSQQVSAIPVGGENVSVMPKCRGSAVTPLTLLTPLTDDQADYPAISVAMGEEGNTVVRFRVNADGSVSDIQVGVSSGIPRLDDAAMRKVAAWRFSSPMLDGKPVSCAHEFRVIWKLRDGRADEAASTTNVIWMTHADYPAAAYALKEEGVTLVYLLISETGTVLKTQMSRSSGYADLDGAALNIAMTRWKPDAATLSGKKVKTVIPLMMVWSLTAR
jgi:TonB family protein